ncbi:BglII/BstYI family type II restriction endonuclease [Roseiarcaceae bacterium H3SJ34-1]|uniref:BglII/BstYI family type II restriction endonuclease n=1 Tax=Terripilifer ovatus TaxID=3032367 RepID=UPI003AB93BF0|nr:BglII/BstYI family type II restriction endonuclease [Roseiarcaceae bacterium H3SJ34-1]
MSTIHLVPQSIKDLYEVYEWRNATGVMQTAHPDAWADIQGVLSGFRLRKSEIIKAGGNKSPISRYIDGELYKLGWSEKLFKTAIKVDDDEYASPTHKIDCYKDKIALEIEWNNKDPFYDRDLNNFRLLFDLRAVEVGIIVTRCSELQSLVDELGRGSSYGQSTTHMGKLLPKIEGGGGGGCPIIVFGISRKLYDKDA